MMRLRRFFGQAGIDRKETIACLAVIGLTYALTIAVVITWGPSP